MWIKKIAQTPLNAIAKVIDSLTGSSTTDAPSIHIVNEALSNKANTNHTHTFQSVSPYPPLVDGVYTLTCQIANADNPTYLTRTYGWVKISADVYKNGTLMTGATLTTFTQETNALKLNNAPVGQLASVTGAITFDVTKFNTVKIKGYVGQATGSNGIIVKIGLDSADTVLSWSSTQDMTFSETYDVSALSGDHAIAGQVNVDNSDSGNRAIALYVTEIMAY